MDPIKEIQNLGLMLKRPTRVSAKNNILMAVDTDKANKLWKQDKGYYISKGKTIAQDRNKIIDDIKERKISAPIVTLVETLKGVRMSFIDGRHRFAVLRDLGVKRIKLSMDRKSAKLYHRIENKL